MFAELYYTIQLEEISRIRTYFFIQVLVAIIFVPIFYSIIYWSYYKINSASFVVISSEKLNHFDFYYMSLLTFTSGGCGEIAPNATIVRSIAATEIFAGIAVFIFIISNADQIIKHVKKNIKNDRMKPDKF